ncbi:CRISPR-associated endonuclease Cas1 [Desulfonema magnum]|uniref:CRISPR-associated endonuclease Cas1 n=1 Tax=Desulfonema magnum TaxID=45655 RepID=A0A975BXT9_9BACT|nr:CRISPR-associated endonuclease Cas1 [Desulfonema magnum]QTA93736.1 CRISPR-associated endonuclease Cas1 [Desulfonema magnum]
MQLFINTPGTLITQKDGCFRLKAGDRAADRSPMKVESLVISNKAMISSQAIVLAMEHNIDVVFLDGYDDPVGRVWFSKMGSTALIRRKQLETADQSLGLELVIDMIRQKMDHQIRFLKKLMYARPGKETLFRKPLNTIENAMAGLEVRGQRLEDARERIRGLEGAAGRAYFQCLSKLMPDKYRFEKRSKRPAKDPFNAVLNYFYGILYSRVEKACILAGLDPYLGFMHTDNYNKKSLVFDMIELFRIYAEMAAVYMFTGRKVRDDYFDFAEAPLSQSRSKKSISASDTCASVMVEAVSLNQKGKPIVAESMNMLLDERIRYRKKNVRRRYVILHEAHRLANVLLAEDKVDRADWLDIQEF